MTIRELIDALQKYPPDAQVFADIIGVGAGQVVDVSCSEDENIVREVYIEVKHD